jgi:hypothetical protein
MPHDDTIAIAIPLDRLPFQMRQETHVKQPLIAQVMDLTAAFETYRQSNSQSFCVGDFVVERQGMSLLQTPPPVMTIFRFIDIANEYDRELAIMAVSKCAFVKPDCFVGYKTEEGDLRVIPHETWRLEPYTGERP